MSTSAPSTGRSAPESGSTQQREVYRRSLLAGLALVTPLGFASKLYRGPGHAWPNDYGGGVLYEVFWVLLVCALWPRARPARVALGVLVVTCTLEALQLWHPPWLQAVRRTFTGATLLGTTFVWWDFPHYALGCLVGWLWTRRLRARARAY